jgi:hypothetical protein
MEARAFGSAEKRSYYKEIKLKGLDVPTLISGFLPIVLGILMWSWGQGNYQYYPVLGKMGLDYYECYMLALLVFLLCLVAPLAMLKERMELD